MGFRTVTQSCKYTHFTTIAEAQNIQLSHPELTVLEDKKGFSQVIPNR